MGEENKCAENCQNIDTESFKKTDADAVRESSPMRTETNRLLLSLLKTEDKGFSATESKPQRSE